MTPTQNQWLRHAAREVLATRPGIALDLSGIARRIRKERLVDFDCTDADIEAALAFLAGLDPAQVKLRPDGLGSTKYYQATSSGVLAFERGDATPQE